MLRKTTRRQFVKRTAAAGVAVASGVWTETAPAQSRSPSGKLNIGAIGVGNRGVVNTAAVSDENIVALCDVDATFLDQAGEQFPNAARYRDFRKLLEHRDLDAVVISTPDHTHFHPALLAMRRGLHVYIEKPLAHSIHECRELLKLAREKKVVTQMGNQHHSSAGYRRAVELVQSSAIGEVREVHSWTSRPLWPQGIDRPSETPAVPKELDWDLWIGPAPLRPYHSAYHPMTWRGWWDFGVGALGDMGAHLIDPAYWGLKLTLPTSVEAESSPVNNETAPEWSVIKFEFPAREKLPPVTLTWYDGGKQPAAEITGVKRPPNNGTLLIGSRAKLFAPELGKPPVLVPNEKGEVIEPPKPFLPESPGHHAEWIAACKGAGQTGSDFEYAARLTETCLLGNVALRTGKKIQWDADRMRATNCAEADQYVRREYREGWRELG